MALGLVVLAAAVLPLVVAEAWFPLLSGNNDEPVYLLQADLSDEGRFTLPVDDETAAFMPWLAGEHDGRVVFPFNPPFPVLIAAADGVFGDPAAVHALVGAGLALSGFAFFRALSCRDGEALLAAALLALSPFAITQAALYLPYAATLVLGLCTLAATLRAVRGQGWRWPAVAGVLFGLIVWTRPFDGLLYAFAALVVVVVDRREVRHWGRMVGPAALGAVAVGALVLACNLGITGDPLVFGIGAAGDGNGLGFGMHSVSSGAATVDYTPGMAVAHQLRNLRALPSWALGGWLVVGLAVVGAIRSPRREVVILLAPGVAFVVGYVLFWGTSLSAVGAPDGVGPHYLMPVLLPLAGLGARGVLVLVREAPRHRRMVVGVLVAVGVAATVIHLPSKAEDKARQTERYDAWADAVGRLPAEGDLLVMVDDDVPDALGAELPFLVSRADERERVTFVNAIGPAVADLPRPWADRSLWQLRPQWQAGDDLFAPGVVAEPAEVVAGPCLEITAAVEVPRRITGLRAYTDASADDVRAGTGTGTVIGDPGPGEDGRARWIVSSHAVEGEGATVVPDGATQLRVGVAAAPSHDGEPVADRWEHRFRLRVVDDTVSVVAPGSSFHRTGLPGNPWFREASDPVLDDVEVTAAPCPVAAVGSHALGGVPGRGARWGVTTP